MYIPIITILKTRKTQINTIYGRFFHVLPKYIFSTYKYRIKISLHFNIYVLNRAYFVNLKNV